MTAHIRKPQNSKTGIHTRVYAAVAVLLAVVCIVAYYSTLPKRKEHIILELNKSRPLPASIKEAKMTFTQFSSIWAYDPIDGTRKEIERCDMDFGPYGSRNLEMSTFIKGGETKREPLEVQVDSGVTYIFNLNQTYALGADQKCEFDMTWKGPYWIVDAYRVGEWIKPLLPFVKHVNS